MTFISGLAIYLIIWWLVLFMILPFGAKDKISTADVEEGQDAGAPVKPRILKKLLATTLVSLMVFAIFYITFEYGFINFRQAE